MSNLSNNAAGLLSAQINDLGKIRNASTRDLQFKQWRQNTLTVIQRLWPGDTSRSERFRRIPFTPPSTQGNARDAREYFERGCGEALEYLNSLRKQLEGEGAPAPPVMEAAPDNPPGSLEGDYPTVQLPGDASPASEGHAGPPRVPSRPGEPAGQPAHGEASAPPPLPGERSAPQPANRPAPPPVAREKTALPPAQRVSIRGEGETAEEPPSTEKTNPLRDILSSMSRSIPSPASEKPKRGRKANRQRLKDMLGFVQEPRVKPEPGPAPRVDSPSESAPQPPAPPARPAAGTPAPAPGRDARFELEEFFVPGEPMLPLRPTDGDASPPAPEVAAPVTKPESLRVEAVPAKPEPPRVEAAPAMPEPPRVEAAPASPARVEFLLPDDEPNAAQELELPAEARDPGADETSRMTAEFLMSSPVLSSLARPVQRRGATTGNAPASLPASSPSIASQLMLIASEVESLGVPEGQRALTRATLVDLARLLETGDISWDSFRDAVQFLMQFAPLARRTLPLLMPYLDIAA